MRRGSCPLPKFWFIDQELLGLVIHVLKISPADTKDQMLYDSTSILII